MAILLESQPAIMDCMVVTATGAHTTMDSYVFVQLSWTIHMFSFHFIVCMMTFMGGLDSEASSGQNALFHTGWSGLGNMKYFFVQILYTKKKFVKYNRENYQTVIGLFQSLNFKPFSLFSIQLNFFIPTIYNPMEVKYSFISKQGETVTSTKHNQILHGWKLHFLDLVLLPNWLQIELDHHLT